MRRSYRHRVRQLAALGCCRLNETKPTNWCARIRAGGLEPSHQRFGVRPRRGTFATPNRTSRWGRQGVKPDQQNALREALKTERLRFATARVHCLEHFTRNPGLCPLAHKCAVLIRNWSLDRSTSNEFRRGAIVPNGGDAVCNAPDAYVRPRLDLMPRKSPASSRRRRQLTRFDSL